MSGLPTVGVDESCGRLGWLYTSVFTPRLLHLSPSRGLPAAWKGVCGSSGKKETVTSQLTTLSIALLRLR